jgi:hypothetical protein
MQGANLPPCGQQRDRVLCMRNQPWQDMVTLRATTRATHPSQQCCSHPGLLQRHQDSNQHKLMSHNHSLIIAGCQSCCHSKWDCGNAPHICNEPRALEVCALPSMPCAQLMIFPEPQPCWQQAYNAPCQPQCSRCALLSLFDGCLHLATSHATDADVCCGQPKL